MDGSTEDCATQARLLLLQLDLIFDCDPLIDELGFVHPSQLTILHSSDESKANDLGLSKIESNSSSVSTPGSRAGDESHFRADCSRKTEHDILDDDRTILHDERSLSKAENGNYGLPYDTTAFWCGDHKLAISMLALGPMYKCAKAAFTAARIDYKKLLQAELGAGVAECSPNSLLPDALEGHVKDAHCQLLKATAEKVWLENRLLSYSRALVLINCDHASAWNTRRQIILSRGADRDVLKGELHLAGVVLSFGPKSEEAWAYRRWVINRMISGGVPRSKLDAILDRESKLVEVVAGTLGSQQAS